MNKSQVILGIVAFVVSAANAWAFKSNKCPIFAKTNFHGCKITNCFTTSTQQIATVCMTQFGTVYNDLFTTASCGSSHAWPISLSQTAN